MPELPTEIWLIILDELITLGTDCFDYMHTAVLDYMPNDFFENLQARDRLVAQLRLVCNGWNRFLLQNVYTISRIPHGITPNARRVEVAMENYVLWTYQKYLSPLTVLQPDEVNALIDRHGRSGQTAEQIGRGFPNLTILATGLRTLDATYTLTDLCRDLPNLTHLELSDIPPSATAVLLHPRLQTLIICVIVDGDMGSPPFGAWQTPALTSLSILVAGLERPSVLWTELHRLFINVASGLLRFCYETSETVLFESYTLSSPWSLMPRLQVLKTCVYGLSFLCIPQQPTELHTIVLIFGGDPDWADYTDYLPGLRAWLQTTSIRFAVEGFDPGRDTGQECTRFWGTEAFGIWTLVKGMQEVRADAIVDWAGKPLPLL
ncbi:hypothetical protein M408DRAFT_24641 [Serendipita vermifera MAFF 305830]|uniref:Uncharacterized protein n=1 Tax=Serendipita vermifera MAFF 305830 TaxID=933852 RepID=A0A0C3B5G3_SERVB|nr:hypothetical protein M408DRAFT_24641 [Serendipita vermifera MAFF 305830]